MRLVQEIIYRLRSAWPERSIARDLGVSRRTVREYRERAEEHGFLAADAPLPDAAAVA
ncbi:MAG: helix-turn-helix domain-containing protein, partial [Armatimonadetes bacterium]|nr:helix-turn-helix domain-containing protein [Armatimonadota bacterium]